MTRRVDAAKQRGAALLLFMLVIIVATATILVSGASRDRHAIRQQTDTRAKLEVAREALLDYATLRVDAGDGLAAALPCPDIDNSGGFDDGEAHDTACGAAGVTVIGRLPWKTLGVPALKDTGAACLWYAVSGSWKDAGPATAAMINADTNGSLQLFSVETGNVLAGLRPDERPVAMVFAAMQPVQGQVRPAAVQGRECAPAAAVDDYLDDDTVNGIFNATLSGAADVIELFSVTASRDPAHNDRVATLSRADVAERLVSRTDYDTDMRDLGLAAAACVANYAANNPGGPNDRRMPWPATVALADYREATDYDDVSNGMISGRLADRADDSNVSTGNTIARVLSDCNVAAVPAWTAEMAARWNSWKDHFFYAVGPSFAPDASAPSNCSACLTVNGAGQYAAVLIFGNARLGAQRRDAPPTDPDTKLDPANYLEAGNATAVPGVSTDFTSGPASPIFNDLLFCIDENLVVTEC
ncbi:MAG: hypothetical protein AAFN50_03875 [Pseudomonadota bacterium]